MIVRSTIKGVTSKQVKRSQKVLRTLREFDDLRRRIAVAKNTLESYIYETRAKLDESEVVLKVSTEESREQLMSMLTDSEDWLYDQPDDTIDPFEEKLQELKTVSDPIFYRAYEFDMRPKAIEEAERILNYTRDMLSTYAVERPWIPEADTTKLAEKLDHLESWIANKTAEQETKELTEEPAFYSGKILDKLKPIAKLAEEIIRFPKPKDKPKKKKKKSTNATKANTTTINSTSVNATMDNTTETNKTTPGEWNVDEQVETETTEVDEEVEQSDGEDAEETATHGEL